jgi:LCP family protein required for cell wall assembly
MTSPAYAHPAFSRLDAATLTRAPHAPAQPTAAQRAAELTLFGVFGVTIVLSAIALYSMMSPAHLLVPNRIAEGIAAGRVNILIVATSQDGRTLSTDSLTMLSIRPRTRQIAMISIPRDLWVQVGRYGSHRLASAMNIGNSSGYPGEGPGLVGDTVEKVVGQPVHAFVRIDTAAIGAVVDALGGIDVDIRKPFYDFREPFHYRAGRLHMNGKRALRYASSPDVSGNQGTRFSREMREQQIIAALLERIARSSSAERARIAALASPGQTLSTTNMTRVQIERLRSLFDGVPSIAHVTFEPLIRQFEVRSFFDPGEAVRPLSGDFLKLQARARNVFDAVQPVASLR